MAFTRTLWRRGARGQRLFSGVWNFFFGLFLVFMLSMHGLVIVGLRLFERPEGTAFTYDYYLFSLLLLAAVLIARHGTRVRRTPSLVRRRARRSAA